MSGGDPLPELLAEIAELLGEGAMLRLAQDFGGTEIYVPAPERIGPEHPLARSLGLAPARRLAETYPGYLDVPLGPTASGPRSRRAAMQALAANKSVREAARHAGMTMRAVWKMKARGKKRTRRGSQRDLFGGAS